MVKNNIKLCKIIFLILIFSEPIFAEEIIGTQDLNVEYKESESIGLNYINWNEKLLLQSNGVEEQDTANLTGLQISYDKNYFFTNWGFSYGLGFATGKASGGGNNSIFLYQKNIQDWKSISGQFKMFTKIKPRIYFGLQVPFIYKETNWPSDNPSVVVSSGNKISTGVLFEALFRINIDYDFFNSIGFLNLSESSTVWRIGINYRL